MDDQMPARCPRCKREMDSIAAWWSVKIDDDETIHVCGSCHEEATHIDKVFAEACTRAKRIWYSDVKIERISIRCVDPKGSHPDIPSYKWRRDT